MANLQQIINQDPGWSMARELDLFNSTIRKKIRQQIHYKSYAFRRGPFMNTATKERRLAKTKLLLNRLKVSAANSQLIFFLDKKTSRRIKKSTGKTTGGFTQTSLRSPL